MLNSGKIISVFFFLIFLNFCDYILIGVLEEEDDVLENVNIVDNERYAKNVENKKKKPDYRPYEEPEFDEFGIVSCCRSVNCFFYLYVKIKTDGLIYFFFI